MVLQQQTQARLWGKGVPGTQVQLTTGWNNQQYQTKVAADSLWEVRVNTPEASFTPYQISITGNGQTTRLDNILIGEVWLCGGQSNMEMPMKGYGEQPVADGIDEILRNAPALRSFKMERRSKSKPQFDAPGSWQTGNPNTLGDFSATGYYFGKYLQQVLNVPIGLLYCNWGGSTIEAWISPQVLEKSTEFRVPATDAEIKVPNQAPGVLYNGMIKPIEGYAMRGAIWYQGESNKDQYASYPEWFSLMHSDWENRWQNGSFPIYFCQIAPYSYGNSAETSSALFREAQLKISQTQPNTGMAVLMDTGEENCIHPADKKAAGQRLALQALGKTYDYQNLHYQSPEFEKAEFKDGKAYLSFVYAPAGMLPRGEAVVGLEIAGDDRNFVPAKGRIENGKLVVWAEEVVSPVAVRYLFHNYASGNLRATNGLPVSSFRTDNW